MPAKSEKTRDFGKASSKGSTVKKKGPGLSKWEKIGIPIIILVAVWAVYSFSQPSPPSSSLSITASTTISQAGLAPDFTLPIVGPNGPTGQTITLSAFRGKVVFLEFMEPWCPHCQNMAPVLAQLYSQYGKGNVVFISVAGPWNGATASDAATFISQYGTSWTYVYDSSGTIFQNYGVDSTPSFFIIGTDGTVSNTYRGEQSTATLSGAISSAGGV
jgi:thiol-disulfide isomerase/thioredoxin